MEIGILARHPGETQQPISRQRSTKKIEFEFGPSTCKAPYRQLHESGELEEPFASPLYISSMGISFSSTVLPSLLEYCRRETPDLSLLVTESRYPLRKRSSTSG